MLAVAVKRSMKLDKDIAHEVIDILNEYPIKQMALHNLKRQKESGLRIAGDLVELDQKIHHTQGWLDMVDQCIKTLPPIQQKIVELKYMTIASPLDNEVQKETRIGHQTFYNEKSAAIHTLAKLLGFII